MSDPTLDTSTFTCRMCERTADENPVRGASTICEHCESVFYLVWAHANPNGGPPQQRHFHQWAASDDGPVVERRFKKKFLAAWTDDDGTLCRVPRPGTISRTTLRRAA